MLLLMLISNAHPDVLEKIQKTWATEPYTEKLIIELHKDLLSHPKFTWANGYLKRHGKLVIGNNSNIKELILHWLHDSATRGILAEM